MGDENKIYAPVVVITCNRYEHFRACIESLQKNTLAVKTEIFIGLDYPPSSEYEEGYHKIEKYLDNGMGGGFKKVHVFKREYNFGVKNNWNDLVNKATEKYDRYIGTEDDNVFSVDFLDYMNYYLELYSKDNRVFSICGHALPEEENFFYGKTQDTFARRTYSGWGVGIWKNKWQELLDTISQEWIEDMIKKTSCRKISNRARYKLLNKFICDDWEFRDTIITFYLWFSDKYQICPCKTKVKNNGWDGSGVTCADMKERNEGVFEDSAGDFICEKADNVIHEVGKDYYRSVSKTNNNIRLEIEYYIVHILGFKRARKVLSCLRLI